MTNARYFNPRPPRGGRLQMNIQEVCRIRKISIHAPREGGDDDPRGGGAGRCGISIHAPREGGDRGRGLEFVGLVPFQSTPPARGATARRERAKMVIKNFNPRPPRGGRPCAFILTIIRLLLFQSTPPARGATTGGCISVHIAQISIHAPREGGDP